LSSYEGIKRGELLSRYGFEYEAMWSPSWLEHFREEEKSLDLTETRNPACSVRRVVTITTGQIWLLKQTTVTHLILNAN